MPFSQLTITGFKRVFNGNYSVKGRTTTKAKNEKGKLEAKSFLDKTAITTDDIVLHLEGKSGIGMCPIDEEGLVHFGVIDIDVYSSIVDDYIKAIHTFGIPLTPFYSKSKGIHAYVFFSEGYKPSDVVDFLVKIRIILGLPKDTELFPKQREASSVSYGSWINLPYFAANDPSNCRKMVRADGTLASVEEALAICEKSGKTLKELEECLNNLPLSDAPPCLQTIYLLRKTDFRNEYLFSLATYYKTKYEDNFETEVREANKMLFDPIDDDRLTKTVISSQGRKNYAYKCGQPPLNLCCNRQCVGSASSG